MSTPPALIHSTAAGLNTLLPKHQFGLFLSHNEHRNQHQEASFYVRTEAIRWKDSAAKQRAIATDEIWELHWYPDSSLGFYHCAAPTLEELLSFAAELSE